MSSNLNKSRMSTFYGVSQCKNCGTSCPSRSEVCRSCLVHLPVVKERKYLTGQKTEPGVWGGNSHGATGDQVTQDSFQSAFDDSHTSLAPPSLRGSICSQAQHFSNEWQEDQSSVRSTTANTFQDTSAQASFSLDMELERHSQMFQASSLPACPNRQVECKTVTDNRSYLDLGQEMPPEYYSFNSTMFDETSVEWVANGIQSAEHASVDSLMATNGNAERTENNLTTSSDALSPSEVSVACVRCPSEWTNLDATADESLQNNPRDDFHSIMEESVNSEPCLNCSGPPEGTHAPPSQKPQVDQAVKLDVGKGQQTLRKEQQSVDELLMFISPDESGDKLPVSVALRPATVSQAIDATSDFRACFTSTQECEAIPSTTDASTETDAPSCLDQDTQTIPAPTAEKSVITEVYIADLDFLTKEFLRLKSVEEELEKLKANQLKPTMECGCECGQRLKQAGLKLLALQYAMCQAHCWRRYYNSGQGETELQCTGGIPESLAETLHALEQDYIQMRRQVLSGVALDDLTPLSVDTHRLNTESRYTPAQDILSKFAVAHTKPDGVKNSKMVSPNAQKSGSSIPGSPEEGGGITSEDWYDAEEDVGPAGQGLKEKQLRKVMKSEGNGKVGDGDGRKIGSHLCIADLPNDITEEDLLLLLEKYQPKEVCFTKSNTSRTATVTMSSPENAEAALQDLSGSSIHGQPIQVRRISRLPAAGPEGDRTFKKPHTPSATRPADSGNMPKPGSVKETTPYNMSPKPIRYCTEKLVKISDMPTATGTYVPQQPPANTTTMGSFDTLMVRLSERHPEVTREKFVEALLGLRAQHRGSLSGLPLRTIVEMTSELLTAQALRLK